MVPTMNNLVEFGSENVDVAKRLVEAGMSKLPYHMQCETVVWSILDAENKSAAKEGRVAFAYIDLTAKEVAPLWLPQDEIGGKSIFGSEGCFSESSTSSLAELRKRLAMPQPFEKCFVPTRSG